ncbi:MAG: sigma-70 family RNA polymerase sigma factor [bacterium]|nr:sigma-70 family RNA polymerase sigma factor [bacterium]
MTCLPSQTATPASASERPDTIERSPSNSARPAIERAAEVLALHEDSTLATFPEPSDDRARAAGHATALMDLYRRTSSAEAFEALVGLVSPDLLARVRSRLRRLGAQLDPQEVLQDAIVNVFRYPDKFSASRYNAFAAWSATIVDNAIRRQLRKRQSGPAVALSPIEVLSQQADTRSAGPALAAVENEETRAAASAFQVVLTCYLAAFERLSDRERFVLQMVEVQRMRYAELGELLGIRAETIKMVVFRARKRINERMNAILRPVDALSPAA